MTPESAPYKAMTESFTDVNMATVKDTRCTFHNYSADYTKKQSHIDFCFINGGFLPVNYTRLDKTFEGEFPSDHYGIAAKITL